MGSCFGRAEEDAIYLRDNLQLMGFDVKDIQKLTALYESIVEAKQAVSVETFAGLAGIVTSPFLQKLFRVPTEIRRSICSLRSDCLSFAVFELYAEEFERATKAVNVRKMPAILEDIHGSSSIDPDVAEKLHAQFEELNAGYPNQMMTYDEFEAFVRTCQGFVFPRCLELQEKLMDASSLGRARWKELSKIRKDNSPKGPLSAQDYIEAMSQNRFSSKGIYKALRKSKSKNTGAGGLTKMKRSRLGARKVSAAQSRVIAQSGPELAALPQSTEPSKGSPQVNKRILREAAKASDQGRGPRVMRPLRAATTA